MPGADGAYPSFSPASLPLKLLSTYRSPLRYQRHQQQQPQQLLDYYLSKANYNVHASTVEAEEGDKTTPARPEEPIRRQTGKLYREDEQFSLQVERHLPTLKTPAPSWADASSSFHPFPDQTRRQLYTRSPVNPAGQPSTSDSVPARVGKTESWQGAFELPDRSQLSRPAPGAEDTIQEEFEREILRHVDALLQMQHNEHSAQVETQRRTIAALQRTLKEVEAALIDCAGVYGLQTAAVPFSKGNAAPLSPGATNSTIATSAAEVASTSSTPLLPSQQSIRECTDDLRRSILSTLSHHTTLATQKILSMLLSIEEGEDVPRVVHCTVSEMCKELAEELMVSVKECLHVADRRTATSLGTVPHSSSDNGRSFALAAELRHAQAEVAALQGELSLIRSVQNDSVADVSPSSQNSSICRKGAGVVAAMQDRLLTHSHAMVVRSREEVLQLQQRLEEERRQHFLTRLLLLRPGVAEPAEAIAHSCTGKTVKSPRSSSSMARQKEAFSPPPTAPFGKGGAWVPQASRTRTPSHCDYEDAALLKSTESSCHQSIGSRAASPLPPTPELDTAIHIAEEVLRSTAPPNFHRNIGRTFPSAMDEDYRANDSVLPNRKSDAQWEQETGATISLPQFAHPLDAERSRLANGSSAARLPVAAHRQLGAGVASEDYEDKVWNKTIELLARYTPSV